MLTIKSKLIALLSYFAIVQFFPLNFFRRDEFVSYHAKQGVVLFILAIMVTFTFWISILGWVCTLAYLVIWFTGAINALSGKKEPVPVVGKIAERLAI